VIMMLRVINRLPALGIATIAAAVLTASTARAQCAHYYGILQAGALPTSAENGGQVDIYTSVLYAASCGNFVNHEFWYSNIDFEGANGYWIEVGFKDGLTSGGGCVDDVDFWADNRNGGGYNEHYPGNGWNFNEYYDAEVQWSGSACQWNVILGGVHIGTSTSNCLGSGRSLNAGIEQCVGVGVSEYDEARGYLTEWEQQESPGGAWANNWGSGIVLYSSNPPNIEFLSSSETEEVIGDF